jgi:hypothetical protein
LGDKVPKARAFFGYAEGRWLGDVFPDHRCRTKFKMRMVEDSKPGKFREFSVP